MIDTNTEFGQRIARRLADEQIIWLTTVSKDGTAQPRPIWFLWDGESMLMYSQPKTYKLAHIKRNPRVALNFDGNGQGGDIVVFTAECHIDKTTPRADTVPAFIEKYQEGITRIGMTPQSFAETYSVPLRLTLNSVRGH